MFYLQIFRSMSSNPADLKLVLIFRIIMNTYVHNQLKEQNLGYYSNIFRKNVMKVINAVHSHLVRLYNWKFEFALCNLQTWINTNIQNRLHHFITKISVDACIDKIFFKTAWTRPFLSELSLLITDWVRLGEYSSVTPNCHIVRVIDI